MFADPTRTWFRGVACGLAAVGLAGVAPAQAPPRPQQPVRQAGAVTPAADDYATRPVALIYGNVPVTRQELGEFLIARGGSDKLELVVNKMIIEHECKKRGVTVTAQEMEAALLEDLEGLSIKKADF